ncbi:NADH-ubiquinone oxidoreductase-F iron-sulfur binding region domain-containing protein [Streptomyces sp. NPDC001663]|uniref:NADH-ubiquinone oxidoreductase-F iron-sulfur binding region domain-containing protein n=1 Tax=Streptomyces sp. NPDC001663 TaxID=3364597 RepID=UPI00369257F1
MIDVEADTGRRSALEIGRGRTQVMRWPGVVGGILREDCEAVETLADYMAVGGYQALSALPADEVHAHLSAHPGVTLLRGRGGAAFPFWRKVENARGATVRRGLAPVVVANGAEGEPLSVKDRYLMRHRPHLVLDGLALTAAAVGAARVLLYVSDPVARTALAAALSEAQDVISCSIEVFAAQDTYVAGEESALVRAVQTGIARPVDGPPYVYNEGIGGAPTLVSNVETLARVARSVQQRAGAGDASFLATVSGPRRPAVLVEVPEGLPVVELLRTLGFLAGDGGDAAVVAGGFFGGILPLEDTLRFEWSSFREAGGGLGCASLYVVPDRDSVMDAAGHIASYYAANNARQCRSCIDSIRDIAHHLTDTAPPTGHLRVLGGNPVEELSRWSRQLVGRGACALPDGVALMLRSLIRHFPDELERHVTTVSLSRRSQVLDPARPAVLGKRRSDSVPMVPVPGTEIPGTDLPGAELI